MRRFSGKGVSSGVAFGRVKKLASSRCEVVRREVADASAELVRLESALLETLEATERLIEKARESLGSQESEIFEIHRMLLEDDDLVGAARELIMRESVDAEFAVATVSERLADELSALEDEYLRARASDIRDVSGRLLGALRGEISDGELHREVIICADDLTPSQTLTLDRRLVRGFVTARGSASSHTAILARSLGIPALVGIGEEALASLEEGRDAALDGFTGELFVSPDETVRSRLEAKLRELELESASLARLRELPAVTKSGRRLELCVNIGSERELDAALAVGADGIGLFRSEFLFLERDTLPDEEAQLGVYRRVIGAMKPRKVVIRTLDLGADKALPSLSLEHEENPALGLRAIRLCLERPELFRTQLRALLRASIYGRLAILLPMIASEFEIVEAKAHIEAVKSELTRENLPFSDSVELGIMIETPAAAILAERLVPLVDFFSIGTNDLTQYTLACDRQNPALERFCDSRHEAVLELIKVAAEAAHRAGRWCGICGELASDFALTERFLSLGIDELSVTPPSLPRLKAHVRELY